MQYNYKNNKRRKKPKINMGLILLVVCLCGFSVRVVKILTSNRERGAFAYVQLLNLGSPLIKQQAYNKEDYAENQLALKAVFLEAIGLKDVNTFNIVNSELCFFQQSFQGDSSSASLATISPFKVGEDSVTKIELNEDNGVRDKSLAKTLDNSKPEVLIYHTHTIEGYSESNGDTTDNNANVVAVGDQLQKELEYYGISVLHDTTNYAVNYNKSYVRSNEGITKYFEKYGDFKLIIDLHRDSAPKATCTANINGENVAKFMLVTAGNSTRYAANKALADRLIQRSNELYPGLCRGLTEYNPGACGRNHSLTDNSILLECGSDTNTIDEAKALTKYVARILAEEINK